MEYVFVVTYGRSGSTLVQGMLNAMPRTLVRGENGLYVQHLFRAWQAADEIREQRKGAPANKPTNAFYGINALTRKRFVRNAHRLVKGGLLGAENEQDYDRLGFKEVEWHHLEPQETAPFFDWFDEVCPDAKYVLNTRDVEQVMGSGFWQRRDAEESAAAIDRVLAIQEHLRTTRPDRVLDTRYEVITGEDRAASDAALTQLAEFVLGRCDETQLDALRATLEVGHGPNPFGKSRRDQQGA